MAVENIFIRVGFIDKASKGILKLTEKMKQFSSQFAGWALSILFGGMLIQRTFTRMATSGIKAFTRILESSNIFGTAIQRLTVHWEFLKFTIGSVINSVLEPLMPRIIEIVSAVTEWIQTHPKLTAGLILAGIALGFLLFLVGSGVLLIKGLAGAWVAVISTISFLAPILSTVITGIAGILGVTIGWAIAIIALVLLVAAAIIFNWFGVRDKLMAGLKRVWSVFKPIFLLIKELALLVWELIKVGAFFMWLGIKKVFKMIWEWADKHLGFIIDRIRSVIDMFKQLMRIARFVIGGATNAIRSVRERVSGITSRQSGGFIPSTGPYLLHAGERVIPANQNSFGNINVTVNTTGGVDGSSVAQKILDEIRRHTSAATI